MSILKKSIGMLTAAMIGLAASAGAATYKIGFSGAITGPTSDAGVPYSRGVADYCKYVNQNKLLGNDKLDCLIRDDGYKNDTTKENFEEFLDEEIVAFLGYATGAMLSLKEDFEEEEIPVIPASMHADNVVNSKYIFLPIASYSSQVLGLVEYISRHEQSEKAKIAMFIHPSAFGRAPLKDVKAAIAKGLSVEIVEVVEHGKNLDNTAMLKRLVSKGVTYIVSHTVQSPVATMLKDAKRLNLASNRFGQHKKLTFLGAHYTGGSDLINLAGNSAKNFIWATSYRMTHEKSMGSDLMKKIGKASNRDNKTIYSHNYTNGVMVTQIAVEGLRRAKAANPGKKITNQMLAKTLNKMNGNNAYDPKTTVAPVTYSKTDRAGVDQIQLYQADQKLFNSLGMPFSVGEK